MALLLEPGEGFAPGGTSTTRSLSWRFARQLLAHPAIWTRVAGLSLLVQVFALSLPLLTSTLVDRVAPRRDFELLAILGAGLAAGLAAMVVFSLLSTLTRTSPGRV